MRIEGGQLHEPRMSPTDLARIGETARFDSWALAGAAQWLRLPPSQSLRPDEVDPACTANAYCDPQRVRDAWRAFGVISSLPSTTP